MWLLLQTAGGTSAQIYLSVASSDNGSGLFSYTFTLNSPTNAWGMQLNNGALLMQFHGLQNAFSPAGWTASITNDFVTWNYTNAGTVFLGSPAITFSIQSSSTVPVLYNDFPGGDNFNTRGVVFGTLFSLPSQQGIGGGYEAFPYMGPAQVPEPAIGLWLMLGGAALASRRVRR